MAVRVSSTATSLAGTGGLLTSGGAWTITFWSLLRADTNVIQMLLDLHNGAGAGLRLETAADGVSLRGNTYGGIGTDTATVAALVPGTWYRVAASFDGAGNYTVHVGAAGGALSSLSATASGFTATELLLGRESATGGTFWDGDFAAVKTWTAALSVAQLENEWSQYQPLLVDQLGRWHPLVGPALDLVDYSGNGRTLTGGTPSVVDGPPVRWARSRGPRVKLSTPPAQTVTSSGIASAEAFGTGAVTSGAVAVSSTGVASGEAFGSGQITQTITSPGIPSAEVVPAPVLIISGAVASAGIPSGEAFGSGSLFLGPVAVTGTGIPSAEAVPATSSVVLVVASAGIGTTEAFGAGAVTVGAVTVSSAGIASAEAFGAHLLVPGQVAVSSTGIPSAEVFGVHRVNLTLFSVGIPSAAAFGAGALVPGPVSIYSLGIPSAEAFGDSEVTVTLDPTKRIRPVVVRIFPRYEVLVAQRVPSGSGPPTFLQLDPIDWLKLTWSSTLSRPQTLSVTCKTATITESVAQRLRNPDRQPIELWVSRNGRRVFAGPLLGGGRDGDQLTLNAGGLLSYLQLMIVEQDMRFDQVDQFAIAAALIDQWQNNAAPGATHGHFGIDTSTVGLSGVLRDRSYVRDEIHQVSRRVEELGAVRDGFDAEVDPTTRKLQLWYPGKGVDRSTGDEAIVFDGRNIDDQNAMFSIAPGDLASDAFGSGSKSGGEAPLWSAQFNAELRAAFGRAAITGAFNVEEQGTLDDHVGGLLDARDQPLRAPGQKVRVPADADLDAYDVGDVVTYELDDLLGIGGAWRIRSRTVNVEQSGAESVDLEFV